MMRSDLKYNATVASLEETCAERVLASGPDSNRRVSLYNLAACFVIADGLTLAVSALLSEVAVSEAGTPVQLQDWQIWAVVLALCTHYTLSRVFDVYGTQSIYSGRHVINRLLPCLLFTFMALLILAVATKTSASYSRVWFFSWMAVSLGLVLLGRATSLSYIRRAMSRGAYVYKALSIGVFCDPIRPKEIQSKTQNAVLVAESLRLESLDAIALLAEKIALEEIDRVYISALWVDIPVVMRNLDLLRHLSTKVFILPGDKAGRLNLAGISLLGERPLFCAMEEPIQGWSLWLKRLEDVIIAGAALFALFPVLAFVALAIRLDSEGPIFFRQDRKGFNGKIFKLWKFRSMHADATDHHAAIQTSRNDPRVTRVGRFIRRTSIDELPQLINVLQGTMSIVGPRPHAMSTQTEGRNLEELVDYYAVRHRVRPGITGWAQINGLRGELNSVQKLQSRVDFDIEYIDKWTLWFDIKIILKTLLLVIRDPHAY